MSSSLKHYATALLALAALGPAAAQTPYPGIGRAATPAEVKAWDIDVRPDFKGLPKGAGSVGQGQDVWEAKCASCHGVFGESNEVFSPLVGGTTAEDIKTGRVARLNDTTFPGRTTLMKVSTVSTLWDYINRAMPWNAPKSLKTDEVYAVTAYLLSLGNIVPDDFTLSDTNIADVQKRLPNRNGVTTAHAMWPGKGLGKAGAFDVKATACMHDCDAEPKVASLLPDFARNNNGNLAEQQRLVGPQRGVDTTRPAGARRDGPINVAPSPAPAAAPSAAAAALALLKKHSCTACHGMDQKLVGPGFKQVATKYASRGDAEAYLAAKIKAGGQGVWGPIPMPAQPLSDAELKAIAGWLAAGAANR
ncbi:c-type cytochrome [Roseateles sp.]|uniref:c-type cytochrome n=1 Tax=Roseateles sp. TaxID=1971397 RepID=UPI0025D5DD5D|nr:c-type cytochrome [Roseateles sp.]MBV8037677.1 c-type cytochrome [Roseateles sp.]